MWIYDFDGVLLNSIDEVAVSAYNAATGKMVTAVGRLPAALVRLFKRNRFHFQPAGDVLPLMHWCLDHYRSEADKLLSHEEFMQILAGARTPLNLRTLTFYDARNRFAEWDAAAWLSLNQPFQPIWQELKRRGAGRVVILTNKNRAAVLRQCRHFGLAVREENVYAGDDGATKISNLETIFRRVNDRALSFIDDSLRNLQDLDAHFNRVEKRLRLHLAAWGYIGPDDVATARSQGLAVLNQVDLIRRIDDAESA